MNKLLIGSSVKQKATILEEFLKGLTELDLENLEVSYYFIDDNTEQKSSELLNEFSKNNSNVLLKKNTDFVVDANQKYECNESTHVWKKELINRIIVFKNDIIRYAKEKEFDYLFFVDSDIVMNPCTIKHLITRNVDIISNVFWTQWSLGGEMYPQVWLQDKNNFYIENWDKEYSYMDVQQFTADFVNQMKLPGMYRVGGLGACTLLNKKSIQSGVNFSLIDNVSFWGEDRHFCVRARVLGLDLFVDTVYPAYHIYRETYLAGLDEYKKKGFDLNHSVVSPGRISNNRFHHLCDVGLKMMKKIYWKMKKHTYRKKRIIQDEHTLTLSMIVKNEENRYLKETLENAIRYVDQVLIIDDASTDGTVELCKEILKGVPHRIIVNEQSMFAEEYKLRQLQWKETLKMNPDWILFLDADEIFEEKMVEYSKNLMNNNAVDLYCFRLFDMWNEDCYREDQYWNAHTRHMPFLLRFQPNFKYKFRNTNQHCGRMPKNVYDLDYANINIRVKHYGWAREEDRLKKYERYMQLDPEGKDGSMQQYKSIIDKTPNLKRFEE